MTYTQQSELKKRFKEYGEAKVAAAASVEAARAALYSAVTYMDKEGLSEDTQTLLLGFVGKLTGITIALQSIPSDL